MCGIGGSVAFDGQKIDLSGMQRVQAHRGPDDEGVREGDLYTLVHRRLSIIDLSDAARQPLSNEDGTVWLTFNGEIYNFRSLRAELESLGHRFSTDTDSEVIVHGWEQWGVGCVGRLRGMFAFGLWDEKARRLLLARDRVGKKPLFFTRDAHRLIFASELQGLLAVPGIERSIDPFAIDQYLTWGYVPPPRTGFRSIEKLSPAHMLLLDASRDVPRIEIQRYWRLDYEPKTSMSEEEAGAELRERLTEAVRLRLVSDVPLGAFLSGGIDSSIVVGLMAQLSSEPVKTFSIGFEEKGFDELDHARRIAARWGTDHHEFVVRPDALQVAPLLVRHFGEPFADSSAIPTYYVSKMTREGVKVALNGDGGDESFAGYDRYFANVMATRLRAIPFGERLAIGGARLLPDLRKPRSKLGQARRFLEAAHLGQTDRYLRWSSYFRPDEKRRLYSADFAQELDESTYEWWEQIGSATTSMHPVDACMFIDIVSYLPYDLLVKVDITSMANSLEARSPFLDHEVMEFAAGLPAHMKLRGRTSKYLLKQTFADLLPSKNVNRAKQGFGVPVGSWFRGPLRGFLSEALLSESSFVSGYLHRSELEGLVRAHTQGAADYTARLWNLLMLELWHREVVNQPASDSSALAV